jgi:hypothetical protein
MDPNEGNVINLLGGIDITVGRDAQTIANKLMKLITKIIEHHDLKSSRSRNNLFLLLMISDKL